MTGTYSQKKYTQKTKQKKEDARNRKFTKQTTNQLEEWLLKI